MNQFELYTSYLNIENKSLEEQIDFLSEDDTLTMILGMSITNLLLFILGFFIMIGSMLIFKASSKENKKLSKKVNLILKENGWKVYVFDNDNPNAICIITKKIFITSGIIKFLTERELEACLLHEAYHIKHFHSTKNILMKTTILTICLPLISIPTVGVLIFFIIINVLKISIDITIGRKMELNADSYPIKYGYSKEIESALKKLMKEYERLKKNRNKSSGKIEKILNKINIALDEHPPLKNRIENILKKKEIYDKKFTLQKMKALFIKNK